jgi:hypothetical protein
MRWKLRYTLPNHLSNRLSSDPAEVPVALAFWERHWGRPQVEWPEERQPIPRKASVRPDAVQQVGQARILNPTVRPLRPVV